MCVAEGGWRPPRGAYTQSAEPANRQAGKHAARQRECNSKSKQLKLGPCKAQTLLPSTVRVAKVQHTRERTRKRKRKYEACTNKKKQAIKRTRREKNVVFKKNTFCQGRRPTVLFAMQLRAGTDTTPNHGKDMVKGQGTNDLVVCRAFGFS